MGVERSVQTQKCFVSDLPLLAALDPEVHSHGLSVPGTYQSVHCALSVDAPLRSLPMESR